MLELVQKYLHARGPAVAVAQSVPNALLVQKYVLYWYRSANTATGRTAYNKEHVRRSREGSQVRRYKSTCFTGTEVHIQPQARRTAYDKEHVRRSREGSQV